MVPALVTILTFQLAGEVVSRAGGLPLPGPVVGLVALVAAMRIWPGLAGRLRPAAQGLLAHLSLFFVPAGVGIVAHLPLLREHGLALAAAIAVSTVLALVAGAAAFTAVARLTEPGGPEG
ncbi:CidA/LrgA family protein [Paracoccus luteus]|uniref:CidA/LrgA family protein n=1 Tax=Paracoccus luteus TaxID=2508543 RepID=UPI00106FA161|nr:CidA/LrgA family protein [Paracoccus luteus]